MEFPGIAWMMVIPAFLKTGWIFAQNFSLDEWTGKKGARQTLRGGSGGHYISSF
jgi:hypothetical protein